MVHLIGVSCIDLDGYFRFTKAGKGGYYGEMGYQARTHGVPLLLKTKPGVTTAKRQAAYILFDKLGNEAKEPWAPLSKNREKTPEWY